MSTPHVLVVDDDPTFRAYLRVLLDEEGAQVTEAEDAEAAFAALAHADIDVVLLDWLLPGTSGLGILRTIRADQRLSGLRVVMVTALKDDRDHALAQSEGADAFLVKSDAGAGFTRAIRELIERGR